jgi:NAD(P)-dependent dehydrogenase (short-subunit alcohol dehydrogenase family)
MLLDGKPAVITGAASGVGRAAALRFAAEGARVLCADLNAEGAKETARQIEAAGGTAVPCTADVASEASVAAMVAAAVDSFGRLDIIYNNVGIPTPRAGMSFEEHTAEDYRKLMAVNFGGTFFGCKHAVIQFKRQGDGGVICNTGSVAGLVGWGGALYGSTKGAVHQLTRAVAVECAQFGIRANAVCPAAMPLTGFMPAGGMSPAMLEQRMEGMAAMHPLGRYITAEDCAEAALYLCSDLSRNVTGVLLPVDGGYVAR